MQEIKPLLWKGAPCGSVVCGSDALRWRFTALCERSLRGVCRAYLVGEREERLVGVLVPDENGRFCASVCVSKTQLPRLPVFTHGEVRRAAGSWVRAAHPERVFSDPALRSALCGAADVLIDGELPTRLAVGLDPRLPCPIAPALTLARVIVHAGKPYLAIGIDPDGNPVSLKDGT